MPANDAESKYGKKIVLIVAALAIFLFLVLPVVIILASKETLLGNVAVIKINGEIAPEDAGGIFSQGSASSSAISELIEEADSDPGIKAILIEIDSPGGSAVASEEIMNSIRKTKKPTVALIRDVGASGAYWAATGADAIVASPVSITGSIGVFSSYLEFSRLMEKYGIGYERLVAGEYKDIGVPFRNLTGKEREILQGQLDVVHAYFIKSVSENRNLSEEQVRNVSNGMAYLGIQAKELGLVDELGGKEKAEEILKQRTNLTKVEFVEFRQEKGFFDALMNAMSRQSFHLGEGIGSALGKVLTEQQQYGFRT